MGKLFLVVTFLSLMSWGAVIPSSEAEPAFINPNPGRVVGLIDLRPSDVFKGEDTFRMENAVELGYRFHPQLQLTYKQEIWGTLSQPMSKSPISNVYSRDGYFDLLSEKVVTSEDGTVFLTYEGRIYLPTFAARRDAGMLTAIRNYATIGKKMNSWITVTASETPIVHLFSQDAYLGKANPVFENRFQLKASINLTDKLSLGLPVIWQATKMRASLGASKSDIWDNLIWVNPELFYTIDSHYVLGAGYYDISSLVKSDLSDIQIGDGLRDGVVQFIFKAIL
ncbi:MAG: hypothetical protein EBQ85_02695 [Proteobacteria bacterium]|nr:hypothetical protein [Pseudomonadota bacterium]